MIGHVAAHRWADVAAGRVGESERRALDRHADGCAACKRARARVLRTTEAFAAIRGQTGPEIAWDAVRARVHWSVSKERRTHGRKRVPLLAWVAVGVAAAAGIAFTFGTGALHPDQPIAVTPTTPLAVVAPVAPAAPAAIAGLVSRAAGDVMIDGVRPTDLFARPLVAGSVVATGDGRVDVQFGNASAFALGPKSTLELRRFDAQAIELAVEGTIDVEVAPRLAGQRFLVIAGDQTIEVRGTQFRVSHDATHTTVACRHGLVAVRDAGGQVEVGAARRVELRGGHIVADQHAVPLSVDELGVLARATPLAMPLWSPDALALSAPLEIATSGHRDVRVDGIELGLAPLRVRVMPGRHTVDATDSAGRYRRAGWIDVAAPSAGAGPSRLDVPAEQPSSAGIAERKRQLHLGIDRAKAQFARCTRTITKGEIPGDTFVQIEISVTEAGDVGFLNIIDESVGSEASSCVRDALHDIVFGAGPSATWREKIDL